MIEPKKDQTNVKAKKWVYLSIIPPTAIQQLQVAQTQAHKPLLCDIYLRYNTLKKSID